MTLSNNTVGRILTLYIPLNLNPSLKIENNITYRGKKIVLEKNDIENLLSQVGEYWHTDVDRLIHFTINTDGSYLCERVKDTYNYYTKETEDKVYIFDTADREKVKECTDIVLKFFENKTIDGVQNLQQLFVNSLQNFNFYKTHLLDMRNEFLRESDFMFMSDYPLENSQKEKWSKFRQELRDITETEEWKNGDFLNVSFPVSPLAEDQANRMVLMARMGGLLTNDKFVSSDFGKNIKVTGDFIQEYGKVLVKLRMIEVLSGLGLPSIKQILGFGVPEFHIDEEMTAMFGSNIPYPVGECPIDNQSLSPEEFSKILQDHKVELVSRLERYMSDLESSIKQIDPSLTMGNIWEMAQEIFAKAEMEEMTPEVAELLDDLNNQGE